MRCSFQTSSNIRKMLAREADKELRPKVRVRIGNDGTVERFFYTTANKRAQILLARDGDGWCIVGNGDFKYPDSVLHALEANGFDCVARGATWKTVA